MSVLSSLIGKKNIKRASITLIGPSRAGKTTFIKYLETGKPVTKDVRLTLGIDIRSNDVEIEGWKLKTIDTGGQEFFQQTFWELAIQQADAVIFMIDATIRPDTDDKKYEQMKKQFSYALDIIQPHIPLLILLNKQDLIHLRPLTPAEALQVFWDLPSKGRNIGYIPISAKYGTGVKNALRWLIEKLEKNRA